MNRFVVLFVLTVSFFSTGCYTVVEATKSSLSGIKASSPVARGLGFREETHRVIIKNRLHLAANVFVNGDRKDFQIYPNEDLVFTSVFEPFNTAFVSVVLVFHEPDGEYAGFTARVFNGSAFSRSEAWTIFAGDVTYLGRRLAESPDAPEFEPRVKTARLPREWFSGTGRLSVVNDTDGRLRVTTNGSVRTEDFAPGEIYTVRTRDFSSPSSRWGGRQPVIVQAEAWDENGRYRGIFEREFYPPSYGSQSWVESVNPSALRRR
jgi:hypothetical protein